jgi:hypothetical protein
MRGKSKRNNRLTLNFSDEMANYYETKAGDIPVAVYCLAILQEHYANDIKWHQQQLANIQRMMLHQQQMAGGGNV